MLQAAGSIPDEIIGFFSIDLVLSAALGSTQPLTEMSTRNLSGVVKGGLRVGLTTSTSHQNMGLHGLLHG
jgi:hypothetical protein